MWYQQKMRKGSRTQGVAASSFGLSLPPPTSLSLHLHFLGAGGEQKGARSEVRG